MRRRVGRARALGARGPGGWSASGKDKDRVGSRFRTKGCVGPALPGLPPPPVSIVRWTMRRKLSTWFSQEAWTGVHQDRVGRAPTQASAALGPRCEKPFGTRAPEGPSDRAPDSRPGRPGDGRRDAASTSPGGPVLEGSAPLVVVIDPSARAGWHHLAPMGLDRGLHIGRDRLALGARRLAFPATLGEVEDHFGLFRESGGGDHGAGPTPAGQGLAPREAGFAGCPGGPQVRPLVPEEGGPSPLDLGGVVGELATRRVWSISVSERRGWGWDDGPPCPERRTRGRVGSSARARLLLRCPGYVAPGRGAHGWPSTTSRPGNPSRTAAADH